ncbi:hypothetical protein INT45_005895 [Circinella minor]|uniref:Uncharacterized protein n=1 Tax=Circinella minor TaxID=1195481 RepID=A0A8H7RKL1_9FUNG|nr:hypothetical protein INT45_005895 [Circinella minor]
MHGNNVAPRSDVGLPYIRKSDSVPYISRRITGKESASVRATAVANRIKKAGTEFKKFQGHSLGAASSAKAVELGHSIQYVKKHANWSLMSDPFERS